MMMISLNCRFSTVSSPVSVRTFIKHISNPRKFQIHSHSCQKNNLHVRRPRHSPFSDLEFSPETSNRSLHGFPSRVVPGGKVALLESMNKRCVFMEHVVGSIGLQNVQIIWERAENFRQNPAFRESFDVAVARAVAEMRVLAVCLPLVRVGGLFLAAKGHDPQEEVTKAERSIHLMGASLWSSIFQQHWQIKSETNQVVKSLVLSTVHIINNNFLFDPVESHSKYGQRTAIIC